MTLLGNCGGSHFNFETLMPNTGEALRAYENKFLIKMN
jgi:hypothetical protein